MSALFVGDLHPEVTELMLEERFSPAGHIRSIWLFMDVKTGSSLGYACVNFQQRADAERALETLNFEVLMGRPMRISWWQGSWQNLAKSVDGTALHDTSSFGKVLTGEVAGHKKGSKGYGYVHIESVEAADLPMKAFNGKLQNKCKIEHYKAPEERQAEAGSRPPPFTNIYIKNLSEDTDDKKLREIFGEFGPLLKSTVVTDENGKSKGFGFGRFVRHEDARRALTGLNGKWLNGKRLYVARAKTKKEKETQLKPKFEQTQNLCVHMATPTSVDTVEVEDTVPAVDTSPWVEIVPVPVPAADEISALSQGADEDESAPSSMTSVSDVQQSNATDVPTYLPPGNHLTIYLLESAPLDDQIQMAHDHMLPLVEKIHPTQAKKITWMLLEGENNYKIMNMISNPELLRARVDEMDALLKAREAGHRPETLEMFFNINTNKKKKKKNNRQRK